MSAKIKDLSKLTQEEKTRFMNDQDKQKLESVLENEVQYLLEKKQKEKEMKRRLKQLQDEYQRKRKMQLQLLENKKAHSQQVKNEALKKKLQKNKKNLEHVEKVNKKSKQQSFEEMQKGLQKRKQFYSAQLSKSSIHNKRAQSQQKFSTRQKFTSVKKLNNSDSGFAIQEQMNKIEQKLLKAKNNQQKYKQSLLGKLTQRDRHSAIQQKIRSRSIMIEQDNYNKLYGTNSHIIQAHQKVKGLNQKHLNQRRKSFKSKIEKMQENIKYLESQKKEKFQQLQHKLTKMPTFTTTKGSESANNHRQRVYLNHLKLQEQNKQRSQQIMEKHLDLTYKNQILKNRKDKIIQVLKKVNPEDEY